MRLVRLREGWRGSQRKRGQGRKEHETSGSDGEAGPPAWVAKLITRGYVYTRCVRLGSFLVLLTRAAPVAAQDAAEPDPSAENADPVSAAAGAEEQAPKDAAAARTCPAHCVPREGEQDDRPPQDPLEGPRRGVEEDVVPDARGFSMALRIGWGAWAAQSGIEVADQSLGMAPVWLDLGYRVTKHALVGVYAGYRVRVFDRLPGRRKLQRE